jgi:hypothetical protein
MNVNKVLTKDYGNKTLGERGKNKANSKPNKANLLNAQINVNKVSTKDYENILNWVICENKANIKPKQSQTNPIYRGVASGEAGSNPTCSELACPEPACPEHRRRVEGVEPISKEKNAPAYDN